MTIEQHATRRGVRICGTVQAKKVVKIFPILIDVMSLVEAQFPKVICLFEKGELIRIHIICKEARRLGCSHSRNDRTDITQLIGLEPRIKVLHEVRKVSISFSTKFQSCSPDRQRCPIHRRRPSRA
jgi:hypothetical protein